MTPFAERKERHMSKKYLEWFVWKTPPKGIFRKTDIPRLPAFMQTV
jgi:hypothetical protein